VFAHYFLLGVFVHTISATDLARNTREILDQVASTGQAISVSRNQTVIAQIVQPQSLMTASQALDGLPTTPALSKKQANDWLKDSKAAFVESVRNPWA
jgi:antitoxin (DNA-binding transcriptional repressor) of toxin-antitoxin stability system